MALVADAEGMVSNAVCVGDHVLVTSGIWAHEQEGYVILAFQTTFDNSSEENVFRGKVVWSASADHRLALIVAESPVCRDSGDFFNIARYVPDEKHEGTSVGWTHLHESLRRRLSEEAKYAQTNDWKPSTIYVPRPSFNTDHFNSWSENLVECGRATSQIGLGQPLYSENASLIGLAVDMTDELGGDTTSSYFLDTSQIISYLSTMQQSDALIDWHASTISSEQSSRSSEGPSLFYEHLPFPNANIGSGVAPSFSASLGVVEDGRFVSTLSMGTGFGYRRGDDGEIDRFHSLDFNIELNVEDYSTDGVKWPQQSGIDLSYRWTKSLDGVPMGYYPMMSIGPTVGLGYQVAAGEEVVVASVGVRACYEGSLWDADYSRSWLGISATVCLSPSMNFDIEGEHPFTDVNHWVIAPFAFGLRFPSYSHL